MKQIIKNSLTGIGVYLLAGVVFSGYHYYMFIAFILLNILISYLIVRNKEPKEVQKNLIWINVPILSLLLLTSLFTDNIRVVLPYLIFGALCAVLLYYYVTQPTKRVIYLMSGVILITVGIFSFESISGITEIFDSEYYINLYKKIVNK